jgi:hypothetical protein
MVQHTQINNGNITYKPKQLLKSHDPPNRCRKIL